MVYSELVKSEDWNRADGMKKPSTAQMEYFGRQTADGQ